MRGLQAQMSIGKMDQLVYFVLNTTERDSFGGTLIVAPADEDNITYYRAHVREISAKEAPTDTPQERVTKMIEVEMRNLGASNPQQRSLLYWQGAAWDITDITFTQRQRFMLIKARTTAETHL